MTPYEIRLLLWYYASPTEPPGDEPIRADTKARFIHRGLLRSIPENEHGCCVDGTEKLRAYAEALCMVPEPVQKWVMPDDRD